MLEGKYTIVPIRIPLVVVDSIVIQRRFPNRPRFLEPLDFSATKYLIWVASIPM